VSAWGCKAWRPPSKPRKKRKGRKQKKAQTKNASKKGVFRAMKRKRGCHKQPTNHQSKDHSRREEERKKRSRKNVGKKFKRPMKRRGGKCLRRGGKKGRWQH